MHHEQRHRLADRPAQPPHGVVHRQVRRALAVDGLDLVARPQPRLEGGAAKDGTEDRQPAIGRCHVESNADAGELLIEQLVELLRLGLVAVAGVLVERREHAAHARLIELLPGQRFERVAIDLIEDLGEVAAMGIAVGPGIAEQREKNHHAHGEHDVAARHGSSQGLQITSPSDLRRRQAPS